MKNYLWICALMALWITNCEDPETPEHNEQSGQNPPAPICGNGLLEAHESCDDGNVNTGDGCTSDCLTEYGYTCTEPGILCKINICDNCHTDLAQNQIFTRSNLMDNCHCPSMPPEPCSSGDTHQTCGETCADCTSFGAICDMGTCICPASDDLLNFTAYQNTTSDLMLTQHTYDGETTFEWKQETQAVNALPYHLFSVEVGNTPMIAVDYHGATLTGERIALYAWHPEKNKWISLISTMQQNDNGVSLQITLNTADYIQNGKVSILAAPELNANGADTFAFTGDTQNYTSSTFYIDGHSNGIYNHVTTWVKNQYLDGKIAYMHHAGDVVNCSNGEKWFEQEFAIADEAHRILADAGVPYGITPGNHDIYLKLNAGEFHIRPLFDQTFSPERFQDFSWFVAGPEGYHSHYVLVTIAERDFIFVNVGYDVYPYEWINEVLAKYPHRIAVFSTHAYFANGTRSPQAQRYHRNNIVPNENVEIVLSGHVSKRFHVTDTLADGRKIHQIVVDHSNYHALPDGAGAEGYIRLIRFADGKMYHTTYSPYRDEWLTDEEEQFTLDFPLKDSIRTLRTDHFEVKSHCMPFPSS
jgi:cysteine-rich repeat protein